MSSVPISELEANLGDVLRRVKEGETVTLTDRDTPVARIVPMERAGSDLRVRPAQGRMSDLELLPPLETKSDIVELLIEERSDRW